MADEIYLSYIPTLLVTALMIVIGSLLLYRRQKLSSWPSKKPKTPYHFKWIKFDDEEYKGTDTYTMCEVTINSIYKCFVFFVPAFAFKI